MVSQKIQVIQILTLSYQIFFKNFRIFLKLIWIPALLSLSIDMLTNFGHSIPEKSLWLGLLEVVYLICIIPPITSWHRLIILNVGSDLPRIGFSFKKEEWLYAIRVLIFWVAVTIFVVIMSFLISGVFKALESIQFLHEYMEQFKSIFILAIFAALLLPLSGFLMVFPAAAIGKKMALAETGKYVRNNISRIWLLYLLALAPQAFLLTLLNFSMSGVTIESGDLIIIVNILITTLIKLFFFMITVGVISLSYIRLVEGRELSRQSFSIY
jgi:hypothetical protein